MFALSKTLSLHHMNKYYVQILKDLSIVKQIPAGSTLLVGGFGLCGIPENIINALKEVGTKNLTVVSNNCGTNDEGLGILLNNGQLKRVIASYAGENHNLAEKYFDGELELELIPQGTLAEKLRSAGAGIPAFYTRTGVDTVVEKGGIPIKYKNHSKDFEVDIASKPKHVEYFKGQKYLREEAIYGDYAIIKASVADTNGNLRFVGTSRNFNEDMAKAAKVVIAEVESIVPLGSFGFDHVHVNGIYVDYLYLGNNYKKSIERLVYDESVYKRNPEKFKKAKNQGLRNRIAKRAAHEFKDGMYVNLGIGIPTLIPAFLDPHITIHFHTEIGAVGVGNYPLEGQELGDLVNAGKESITLNQGASTFSSSESFGIVRGGHLDLTVLGAMQINKQGDIANWVIPGRMVKGMGGAMDLVASGSKVLVVMEHTAKGEKKFLKDITLPATGLGRVDQVITDKAVFVKRNGELVLTEIAADTDLEWVRANTGFELTIADDLKKFEI
ncbi:unnamed protein product [Paramecium primaurelia]|uniref:Succinyl-CoA:3-ketoacid-coenzyme A transferase n=2 Tax=Paramecium TaxID=5884 RepID=A0A8S1VSF6_9CILI|nr:unnamed protein product [Paramecium primaurelia]CAD8179671.1 unnamed protein product [Paramecium pentaurelia]